MVHLDPAQSYNQVAIPPQTSYMKCATRPASYQLESWAMWARAAFSPTFFSCQGRTPEKNLITQTQRSRPCGPSSKSPTGTTVRKRAIARKDAYAHLQIDSAAMARQLYVDEGEAAWLIRNVDLCSRAGAALSRMHTWQRGQSSKRHTRQCCCRLYSRKQGLTSDHRDILEYC